MAPQYPRWLCMRTLVALLVLLSPTPAADQDEAESDGTGVCSSNIQKPAVHAAFYLWYGNPQVDGRWLHWNHKVLPHWDKQVDARHPKFDWRPPDEPHSPSMPLRGTYSCRDKVVLREQFQELAAAGVDSAMVSWWGRKDYKGKRDDADSGANTDELIPDVLDAAAAAGVGVSWHIEPYGGRTPDTFLEDLRYIHEQYGSHPGFYREGPRKLPVFWLYDVSAQHSREDVTAWRLALASVRGTPLDGIFFCLWIGGLVDDGFVERTGFDGAYTYFAADGFTPGSTPSNWKDIKRSLDEKGKLFVPAVGPGYDDQRIRPWNKHNIRERQNGKYYKSMWKEAMKVSPYAISVTSYNEWGEGTQIEPAVPHTSRNGLRYEDYSPEAPDFYLKETLRFSKKFKAKKFKESCSQLQTKKNETIKEEKKASGLSIMKEIAHLSQAELAEVAEAIAAEQKKKSSESKEEL